MTGALSTLGAREDGEVWPTKGGGGGSRALPLGVGGLSLRRLDGKSRWTPTATFAQHRRREQLGDRYAQRRRKCAEHRKCDVCACLDALKRAGIYVQPLGERLLRPPASAPKLAHSQAHVAHHVGRLHGATVHA